MTQTLLLQTLYLGANAKVQLIRFAICLGIGLAAGVIALLYLRKARPFERALTDFFATLCIGALFIVCVEFFLDGKFELYGIAAYMLGTSAIPVTVKKLSNKLKQKKRPSQNASDESETKS